ncbi:MAG: bifunctional precorrin-2 dehydrogenase/sirohydrochlorin ferrochelatase [Chloroflexi bacterium]|nr:bifunctional precorrin-2 dehydrogenase/sirohydrochlorin ferrochelatase [Chloroflexota bacterium]
MSFYPVFLDLHGRPCLVTGVGHELERKTEGLLEAGAQVTVVTPAASPLLRDLAAQGRIVLHERPYREGDLAGTFLAVAATTEDLDLSGRIAAEARMEGVLLNVVDVPALCTWIAPAIVRRGEVTVAVSTNGVSPALARFIKEQIDRTLPQEYAMLAEIVAEVRQELRRRRLHPPPEEWQRALDEEALALLARGDWDGVQARLLTTLTAARKPSSMAAHEGLPTPPSRTR